MYVKYGKFGHGKGHLMRFRALFTTALAVFAAGAVLAQPAPFSQLDGNPYNPATEPDIDMFIGNWLENPARTLHGTLIVRNILTPLEGGDPVHPAKRGAVLTDIKAFSHALLYPGLSTTPARLQGEQHILYVTEGIGEITAGGTTAALRSGIGAIVPPDLEFTIRNTGDESLAMYLITEPIPQGFTPNRTLVTTDTNIVPATTSSGHWVHISKRLFTKEDGLAVLIGLGPVWFAPMTMGQPHSHESGVEEIWFAISENVNILLGKELRRLPPGAAYKIPPNGTTPHSTINLTDDPVETFWMMKVPSN